jgi:hypothetical protein
VPLCKERFPHGKEGSESPIESTNRPAEGLVGDGEEQAHKELRKALRRNASSSLAAVKRERFQRTKPMMEVTPLRHAKVVIEIKKAVIKNSAPLLVVSQ